MANEPTLRKTDIEELEDRVTILEGGTPEPHSNTMTKPELEDLEDRITVLEGGTPGEHSNPMRFEFFTSTEERVEELEEQQDDRTVTYDVNGGTGSIDPVTVDSGTEITLNDGSTITPPTNKEFIGWCEATTPTEQKPLLTGKYTVTKNVTLYAIYELLKVTLTYDYNGGADNEGHTSSSSEYEIGTIVQLGIDPVCSDWTVPEGKEFGYWSLTSGDDSPSPVTTVTMNADTTVYIIWKDIAPEFEPYESLNSVASTFYLMPSVELNPEDSHVQEVYHYILDENYSDDGKIYVNGVSQEIGAYDASSNSTDIITINISIDPNSTDMLLAKYEKEKETNVFNLTGTYTPLSEESESLTPIDLSEITEPIAIEWSKNTSHTLTFDTPSGTIQALSNVLPMFIFKVKE